MKDAHDVDGVPLLLKAIARHVDTSSIDEKMNGSMKYSSIITVFDSYCTSSIYYLSAQKKGTDRRD